MTNLVLNPGFEILTGINDFADWTEVNGVFDNTAFPHTGAHAAELDSLIIGVAAISQLITGLNIGSTYIFSFFYAQNPTNPTPSFLNVDLIGTNLSFMTGTIRTVTTPTYIQFVSAPFVATDTSGTLTFRNQTTDTSVLIDDVAILISICYSGKSNIHTRNTITGEIADIEASNVLSDVHEVFSTETNEFVPVKFNIVTGPIKQYRCIKKNALGPNQPSEDFYITSGHKIMYNGVPTKVRNIPCAKRYRLKKPEMVYSICTQERQPILVNNIPVLAWGYEEWLNCPISKTIYWKNNTNNDSQDLKLTQ